MKKRTLSNKELKELDQTLRTLYPRFGELDKNSSIQEVENDGQKIIFINNQPAFFLKDNKPYPTLQLLLKTNFLPACTIDMNAVRFIADGADLMRPGIVEMADFAKDAAVSIIDEKNKKPIAVGSALMSSEEARALEKGKILKTIHHVGDLIWKFTLLMND